VKHTVHAEWTKAGTAWLLVGIVVLTGLLYLFPIIGNPAWHRYFRRVGPLTAGLAIPGHHRPWQPADQPVGRSACWRGRSAHCSPRVWCSGLRDA
jgi:hypothetical protein